MRHVFDPCPEEHAFRFANGARARSLEEFRRSVQSAPADVLQFHRGHFHYWVKDIVQDASLAERVKGEAERARDGEQIRRALDTLLQRTLEDARETMPAAARGFGARGTRSG